MQYVKVIDGKIVSELLELSGDQTISPNSHWEDTQMNENGFYRVVYNYDEKVEKLDFSNPEFINGKVIIHEIPKTIDEIHVDYIKNFDSLRQEDYNKNGVTFEAMVVALWEDLIEGNNKGVDDLQAKRLVVKAELPKP